MKSIHMRVQANFGEPKVRSRNMVFTLLGLAIIIIYFSIGHLPIFVTQYCIVERPKSDAKQKYILNLSKTEMTDIEHKFTKEYIFENGGEHVPKQTFFRYSGNRDGNCTVYDNSKYKVAIIIPIRDRDEQLGIFLNNMIPYLTRQKLNFKIFLVEPLPKLAFNRGLLLNIGYVEALRESDKWNCFMFHDVDCLPENFNTFYECNDQYPLHFTVALSDFNYTTTGYYDHYFGGVLAVTKEQFAKINGYSNLFYGWGSEDDDLYQKSILAFSKIIKQPADIGRYYMLKHDKAKPFPFRHAIQYDYSRYTDPNKREGLSNLAEIYKVKTVEKHKLYTKFTVNYANTSKLLEPYYADKSQHWKPYYANGTKKAQQELLNNLKPNDANIKTALKGRKD